MNINSKYKFQSKNVKISGRKRAGSKTFEAFFMIPVVLAGAIGTVGVIGSSVASGFGYWNQEKYTNYLLGLTTSSGSSERIDQFATKLGSDAQQFLKSRGVTGNLTLSNSDLVMEFINNKYYESFKFLMSDTNIVLFATQVNKFLKTNNVTNVTTIGSLLQDFVVTNKTTIANNVKSEAYAIISTLYGEKVGNTYSKLETWKIVFGVTTAIASLMVLSIIAYWIARIDDRVKTKKDVLALRKISDAADDKEVNYVVGKINNRYSVN